MATRPGLGPHLDAVDHRGGVVLVTGGIGAAFVTSPVFGLLERVTQISFLTWFAVIGVTALAAVRRQGQERVAASS